MFRRRTIATIIGVALVLAACTTSATPTGGAQAVSPTVAAAGTTITPSGIAGTTVTSPHTGSTVVPDSETATTVPSPETDTTVVPGSAADEPESVDQAFAPLDLDVGTCFDDPQDGIDLVTPQDIAVVSCDVPHANEVNGSFDLGGGAFPGADSVEEQAATLCSDAFEGYIGVAHESSAYDFSWYFPTAESWSVGGTSIICFAYNDDLTDITGSVAGTSR